MGIEQDSIKPYWDKRAERYTKVGGWGPGAMTPERHRAQVARRTAFICEPGWCPKNRVTLDYGCGIGMYAGYFLADKYLGIDIAEPHLAIAIRDNPGYEFKLIGTPMFEEASTFPQLVNMEIFFTATVLQHCSDEVVDGLFANVAKANSGGFTFSIYEYANPDWTSKQTMGRTPAQYVDFAARHFSIAETKTHDHMIHGVLCAHTMIQTNAIRLGGR